MEPGCLWGRAQPSVDIMAVSAAGQSWKPHPSPHLAGGRGQPAGLQEVGAPGLFLTQATPPQHSLNSPLQNGRKEGMGLLYLAQPPETLAILMASSCSSDLSVPIPFPIRYPRVGRVV